MAGKRDGGGSTLHGKNVERRREGDCWFYRFNINGHTYYETTGTTDKAKAEKFAAEIKKEKKVDAGRELEAGVGPMRLKAAADAWWEDVGSKNVETGLKSRLDWLVEQIGGSKLLKDITREDISEAKRERARCLRTAGKDDRGKQLYRPVTPATVKATLVTLRSVINNASMAHGAAIRQFDWTTWINKSDEEYDIRVMTPREQKLIWAELDDDVRAVAEFNLSHPKRINELLPLTWPRVDLDGQTIRINLKGKSKLVDDPIGPIEVAMLKQLEAKRLHPTAVFSYLTERTREYNGVKHVAGQRKPMTYTHFYGKWTSACRRVGITDLNPHCLRHTGATRYYWAHPDKIGLVSKMLNHASVETTMRYYAKHNPQLIRDLKRDFAKAQPQAVTAKVTARARAA
jgi:integrase